VLKQFTPHRILLLCEHHLNKVLTSQLCVIPTNWDCQKAPRTTQELKLQIQEESSRIPVDVLRRAMSSVHDRLAECEQRNGGYLEDAIFQVE